MYLMRGTPVEVVTVAIGDIQAFPEVAAVTYVTEDQALERARRELVEFQGVLGDLQANPLPASLEIRLNPGYRDSEQVRRVAQRLQGFRFAVSADSKDAAQPRGAAGFAVICARTPAQDGTKRVALVIDPAVHVADRLEQGVGPLRRGRCGRGRARRHPSCRARRSPRWRRWRRRSAPRRSRARA